MRVIDLSERLSLERWVGHSHSGTHIDSPAYLFDHGKKIDEYPPERFMTAAVLLDLSHKAPKVPIDDEDLEAAEERAGVALREQEAVVLYTGVSSGGPYLSQNGAEYLEFKGVGLVGSDADNIDDSDLTELVAHRILLERDILVLEGLRNLSSIESSRFQLTCLPVRLTGPISPVWAVARLE